MPGEHRTKVDQGFAAYRMGLVCRIESGDRHAGVACPSCHRWRSSRSRRTSSSVRVAPSTLPNIGSPSLISTDRRSRRTGSILRPEPSGINSSWVSGVIPSATRRDFGITTRPTRSIDTRMVPNYYWNGKLVLESLFLGGDGVRCPSLPGPIADVRCAPMRSARPAQPAWGRISVHRRGGSVPPWRPDPASSVPCQ